MKKILVVDDDTDMLTSIEAILKESGYETHVMSDWVQVYGTVRSFRPDLILLDVQLVGMDGRIICQNLKDNEETGHIPVIMISSFLLDSQSVQRYRADDFLAKPFSMEELLGMVAKYAG